MFVRRRRPLARAAMVGGAAYYAGKKVEQGREQDAMTEARLQELEAQQAMQQQAAYQPPPAAYPPPAAAPPASGGISQDTIERLKQLADLHAQGVLTDAEFEQQKRQLLGAS